MDTLFFDPIFWHKICFTKQIFCSKTNIIIGVSKTIKGTIFLCFMRHSQNIAADNISYFCISLIVCPLENMGRRGCKDTAENYFPNLFSQFAD